MDIEQFVPNFVKRLYKKPPARPPVRPEQLLDEPGFRWFNTTAQINGYADAVFDRMAYAEGRAKEMHLREPAGISRGVGGRQLCQTVRPAKGDQVPAHLDLGGAWSPF